MRHRAHYRELFTRPTSVFAGTATVGASPGDARRVCFTSNSVALVCTTAMDSCILATASARESPMSK